MSASSAARQNRLQATTLVQAAEAGDFGAVEVLIAAGVDVNSATEHGMTALMAAVANGHLALVSFLLDSGADFKDKRHDGLDALALAVFFGHLPIVRELLRRGADLKVNDRLGTSPEMWATVRGFHDIVQVLTDAETTNSCQALAHQSDESSEPLSELAGAQEPVLTEALFPDQGLSDETLSHGTASSPTPVQTGLDPSQNDEWGLGLIDLSEVTIESPVSVWRRTDEAHKKNQAQPHNRDEIADPIAAEVTHTRPEISASMITKRPRDLAVEKKSSPAESTYVAKPRYHDKRKSRKLMRELGYITSDWQRSSPVDSTYVAKPRYHEKRKSRKLVRWLAYITSDWQRLIGVTLIVMLLCGLGTVAVLWLLGFTNPSRSANSMIVTDSSVPDSSHFRAQNDLHSRTRAQQIPSTREISDSSERSIHSKEEGDDRGRSQGDSIEHSSSLLVAKPSLPKSSERVNGLHPKQAMTPKQEAQAGSRPAQSLRSDLLSAKSPSRTAAGDAQKGPSGAKAPPQVSLVPLSIKMQRPRSVRAKSGKPVPAATPGRNAKAKVIQWP